MKIKITADRIIDLSKEELDARGISTISVYINLGNKGHEDMIDIVPDDIFKYMKETGKVAQTAAKSPEMYYEFFKQFADEGKSVIHFAASSGTSAICNFAIEASKRFSNVYVVDTQSLSNGIALLVDHAEAMIKAGETDPKVIYEECMKLRKKLQDSFIIETLECLHKGGRCSSLQYFAANLLKIKPVIALNKETSKMGTREKFRGSLKKVLGEYIASTFKQYPNPDTSKKLYIIHCCKDEEMVKYFIDTAASYHNFQEVKVGVMSCNSAVHCGPNTFGLFYITK